MSRSTNLFSTALLRPVNLLAPGIGLILALTWAPWWAFPLSLAVYVVLVMLTLRDVAFVRRATATARDEADAGARIDWRAVARELGRGSWLAPLERMATAERNLSRELAQASDSARGVLSSTLGQVRSAAGLGLSLARRQQSLEYALQSYAGMDPDLSRQEAADKRRRAAATNDGAARRALLDAATSLEESAQTADSLRTLRERTAAQLESLSAMLESVAVRGVRLRVNAGGTSAELAETLGAEMDAVRETLGVLESLDEPAGQATRT